ncbi:hypothetical protein DAPPUDRAFT_300844 [Daphnia pulex]|uniref:Autophagy-related protein 13 n=1 Tax=Daphnia pulex TaxID=6669 RepID=E9HEX2_DAPPU|nr:hypothetical protein DAPPUDRAFT_300844 [Daphnia pulex]|eukprot:EFX69711.1 hypothetical protein DAPPUDRAFT_300844 [Daphnia pulex]
MATAAMSYQSSGITSVGLTIQEQKEIEKYVKFLSQKMVQVIVQSRLGEKVCTPCKANASPSDWFNLGIEDIPEVVVETKKALKGQLLAIGSPPLCVEISLKTVEGDSLILENWCLSVNETSEPFNRLSYTVYSRMSLLLKSIISVSRITPAYKLSGRQGADSFVLCYRVFCGEPHGLGTSTKNCTIGQVDTPIGLYSVLLSYRTQLALSPKDGAMLVKSDHFDHLTTDQYSPRFCRAADRRRDKGGDSSGSGSEPVASDDSQEACRLFVNSPPGNKAPDYQNVLQQNRFSFDDGPKFGAFADPSSARRNLSSEFMLPELPLPTFMKIQSLKDVKKEQERASGGSNAAIQKDVEITDDSTQLTTSLGPVSNSDEFVMVESLKTPFAEGDSSHDVGAFFRECQSAPVSLQSFNRPSGMATLEIGSQLEQFEKDLEGYDDLVQSLGIGADEGGKQ